MSEIEVLRKVLEEATKTVRPEAPLAEDEKKLARRLLSSFVKNFWTTTLGQKLRDELSTTAERYGAELSTVASKLGIGSAYKEVAERLALGKQYRLTWGKKA